MAEEKKPVTEAGLLEKEIETRKKELQDLELKILQLASIISRRRMKLIEAGVTISSKEWIELKEQEEELRRMRGAFEGTQYAIEALEDRLAQVSGREVARAVGRPAVGAGVPAAHRLPGLPHLPGAEAREERKISKRAARAEEMGVPVMGVRAAWHKYRTEVRGSLERLGGGGKNVWKDFGSPIVIFLGIGIFVIVARLWGSIAVFGGERPYMMVLGVALVACIPFIATKRRVEKREKAVGVPGVPGVPGAVPGVPKYKAPISVAYNIYKGLKTKQKMMPLEAYEETRRRAVGASPEELARLENIAKAEQRIEIEKLAKKEKGKKPEAKEKKAEGVLHECPECGRRVEEEDWVAAVGLCKKCHAKAYE